MNRAYREFFILLQLLKRDFYAFGKRLKTYGINNILIYPLLNILVFGYIQPAIYFGTEQSRSGIVLLVGTFAVNMLSLCFNLISPMLYDLEGDCFIEYQLLLIPARLLLLEMIVFPALIASIISLPFFVLAYAFLPSYFTSLTTHWIALWIITVCSALCCASYVMMALCIIRNTRSIRQFWLRFNWPLVVLGGLWLPWHLLHVHFPFWAMLSLADPLTYITEGVRSALIGSPVFIHFSVCTVALLSFFCLFSIGAAHFFKKKLDHI